MADPFQFDDEDDKPAPKKAKPRPPEDEDDRPKSKRPLRDEEDEDEEAPRPRKRKPRNEDDEDDAPPKKKGKGGKTLLIVLGSLFVLCAGGCGGVYFFVVKPIVDKGKEIVAEVKQGVANESVTPEKAKSIKAGMSASEVDAVFGKGQPATIGDIDSMSLGLPEKSLDDTVARWEAKVNAKSVVIWRKLPDVVVVAYSSPPDQGGKVVGVMGSFHPNPNKVETTEYVKAPAIETKPTTPPKDPNPPKDPPIPQKDPPTPQKENKTTNFSATAKALMTVAGQSMDKFVRVSGKIDKVVPPTKEKPAILELENGKSVLSCELDVGFWQVNKFHAGDDVTLVGKVIEAEPAFVRLVRCDVASHTVVPPGEKPIEVAALDLLNEAIADEKAAFAKYSKKTVKITGVVDKIPTTGALQLTGKTEGGIAFFVSAAFPSDSRVGLSDVKVGDTVSIIGTVSGGPPGREVLLMQNGKTKSILVVRSKLAK